MTDFNKKRECTKCTILFFLRRIFRFRRNMRRIKRRKKLTFKKYVAAQQAETVGSSRCKSEIPPRPLKKRQRIHAPQKRQSGYKPHKKATKKYKSENKSRANKSQSKTEQARARLKYRTCRKSFFTRHSKRAHIPLASCVTGFRKALSVRHSSLRRQRHPRL